MKNLLNFGVSNPLTLGMGHPVADRLETLGRARPTTRRSRCLALSAMSVMAFASAPLSIAADETDQDAKVQETASFSFVSNFDGQIGQSYEIVSEHGVKKAYRILEGGEREEADLLKKTDGTYQLTYADGQVIDLPNFDAVVSEAAERAAKASKHVAELEKIQGQVSFEVKEAMDMTEVIESLEGLQISMNVWDFEGLEFSGKRVVVIGDDGEEGYRFLDSPGSLDKKQRFKIIRKGNNESWVIDKETGIDGFQLDDSVVESRTVFVQSSDPLESARDHLEQTRRQLQILSNDESVAFDLENALRDIESAQKSLAEAERRLADAESELR